jgi:uncharacterized membrane protein YbaN (DUF454 family)
MRLLWQSLGVTCVALGVVGIVLPLLPTTPFLLLAAYAFGKSSPRLHAWITNHPRFGPPLREWKDHGAISRRAKTLAVGTMAAMYIAGLAFGVSTRVLIIQAVVMSCCSLFILTRPSPPHAVPEPAE